MRAGIVIVVAAPIALSAVRACACGRGGGDEAQPAGHTCRIHYTLSPLQVLLSLGSSDFPLMAQEDGRLHQASSCCWHSGGGAGDCAESISTGTATKQSVGRIVENIDTSHTSNQK